MQEPTKPIIIPLNPEELERLEESWKSTRSSQLGFKPQIEPGFELEFYAGHALFSLQMRIGILRKYLAPTISPDELAQKFATNLEWIEKDLLVIWESLRLAMKFSQAK